MPTRSKFNSSQFPGYVTYHNSDGTSTTTPDPSNLTWTDSVTFGDNVADWKECLRTGRPATTSMNGTKKEIHVTSGSVRFDWPNQPSFDVEIGGRQRLAHTFPSGNPALVDVTNADGIALGKFHQKLSLINTAIQGGVVIGELRQTLQLIRNPALGLRRLVSDQAEVLRRIRAQRRLLPIGLHKQKVAENLADAWLELQFGWRPLLSDIKNGAQALHRYNRGNSVTTRRITAVETRRRELSNNAYQQAESFAGWGIRSVEMEHHQVIYRGAVRVEAQDPKVFDPALLGFNPGSFVPTAWELIPYSFLIDYFSNIGGIIYGLSNLGTELAWCNRTVRRSLEKTETAFRWPLTWATGVSISGTYATCVSKSSTVERAAFNGNTIPGVAFKIPGFGSLKWLNIAALVASRRADRTWSFD